LQQSFLKIEIKNPKIDEKICLIIGFSYLRRLIATQNTPTKRQIDLLRIKLKKGTVELNRPK
jgi:hypothetical protein